MQSGIGKFSVIRTARALLFPILLLIFTAQVPLYSQTGVEVSSYLHRREVFLGERFIFEIRVRRGTNIGTPDFSHLSALFDVDPIDRSYIRYYLQNRGAQEPDDDEKVFYFRFIALHTGNLQVGAVPLEVDGKTFLTRSHTIRVLEPEETHLFKLSLSLSKDEVYAGEPIVLTAIWHYRDTARYYNYLFPILNHPDMLNGEYVEEGTNDTLILPFGTGRIPIETGKTRLEGFQYETITFRQILTPQKAGYFQFPRGTVQLWRLREGDPYSSHNYETMVVASQGITLRVLPLPEEGRPPMFSGLVGQQLSINASATPVEVNVGDPIKLTISLSGNSSLENALLPPLGELPIFKDQFAFIPHRSEERMEGTRKIFTRVIRARRPDVLEIPPIELVYFDTLTRSYETAASSPIPLVVRSTRMLMEDDLEGESTRGVSGRVEAREGGINFNYEGSSLLVEDQHVSFSSLLGQPLLLLLLIIPPGGFIIMLVLSRLKPGQASRVRARRHRQVLRNLQKSARRYESAPNTIKAEALLASFMEFLSLKIGFPTGALTYGDVARELREIRIDTGILEEVETLFTLFHRNRYAEHRGVEETLERSGGGAVHLSSLVLKIFRELERRIPR